MCAERLQSIVVVRPRYYCGLPCYTNRSPQYRPATSPRPWTLCESIPSLCSQGPRQVYGVASPARHFEPEDTHIRKATGKIRTTARCEGKTLMEEGGMVFLHAWQCALRRGRSRSARRRSRPASAPYFAISPMFSAEAYGSNWLMSHVRDPPYIWREPGR